MWGSVSNGEGVQNGEILRARGLLWMAPNIGLKCKNTYGTLNID